MLMLNTRPAAKGRRNMKAKLEPFSRSRCGRGDLRLLCPRRLPAQHAPSAGQLGAQRGRCSLLVSPLLSAP